MKLLIHRTKTGHFLRWVDSCLKAQEDFIGLNCVLDITDTVVNTLECN